AFVVGMQALRIGDPMEEDTDIGPLATPQVLDDLLAQVDAAIKAGGRVLTGGDRLIGEGNYFAPSVIARVPRTAAVCREEIFGPVALMFRAASMEEAIEIANATHFG